jgi:hypothetical protein
MASRQFIDAASAILWPWGRRRIFFFSKDAASQPIQLLRDAFALQGCRSFTAVTAHQPARKMPSFLLLLLLIPDVTLPVDEAEHSMLSFPHSYIISRGFVTSAHNLPQA